MYYCITNIVLELTYSLMLKFITIFWGGQAPSLDPPAMKVMLQDVSCAKNNAYFLDVNKSMFHN